MMLDDLIAFLAARLDEDEEVAEIVAESVGYKSRTLREVEAKRVIMRYYGGGVGFPGEEGVPGPAMRALAAVWSDHPDYRPEWKL